MELFGWWGSLSPVVRLIISGVFLLASTLLWIGGYFWPWGWVVGGIMLLLSFPSKAERKGYHDF